MDDFFKRTPKFYENQSSVTGNTEDKENAPEENNYDADENEESNEINDLKKSKVVTIEEEKKTLEYQETMNLDIENIDSTNQQIWRSIYEVIHDDYFKAVKLFPTQFLDH